MHDPEDLTAELSAEALRREEAASGAVDYARPVILHDTRDRRITVLPYYVRRSSGNVDTSLKFEAHKKKKGPFGLVPWPEKSLNLSPEATRRLQSALGAFLQLAEEETGKSFLLVPIGEGVADLSGHEPSAVAKALVRALEQEDVVEHLASADITAEFAYALRQSVKIREMQTAVAELRAMLESGEAEESIYQSWCDQHSWVFGNMYVVRDELRELTPHDELDILIPGLVTGFRDIIELKRPDKRVILGDSARRSWYFSADVSKAIGQCHRYLDVLGEVASRGMLDHPEIIAYHLRATIVIGRSSTWGLHKFRALHGLNARLTTIQVMTYDHLLARAERMLDVVRANDGPDSDS